MNKTGLKTFVCSFVLTLSAIFGADRAFFYNPAAVEEPVKIPRKNITLFFSHHHPQVSSSRVEPVYAGALQTPEFEPQELKIAQNMPEISEDIVVKNIPVFSESEEIPLQVETAAQNSLPAEENLDSVPLIYVGAEESSRPVASGQKDIPLAVAETVPDKEKEESVVQLASAETRAFEPEPYKPVTVKATRQIVKIDNLKKRRERLQKEQNNSAGKLSVPPEVKDIPLQNGDNTVIAENDIRPEASQIASLDGNVPITSAEEQTVSVGENESSRHWQTMAEKHQDENPWVVARGSKFLKNKKLLEEEFASSAAKAKGDSIIASKAAGKSPSAKVAVQDNLLIPIPQELLDEDNLVPDLGEGKAKTQLESAAKLKKKEKESSFLDSIASVFSKENREKAIKSLREKSGKIINGTGKDGEDVRPQILPTEIRLSFQPNRAEISGQTLRWIQAFAKKAVDDETVGLEIRIDGSGAFVLQQKRLNLLYNILTANGVDYQKINTVFVEREANSFIVRTVKIAGGGGEKKEDDGWKKYYQQW